MKLNQSSKASNKQKSRTRFITKDFNQTYKEELTIFLKTIPKNCRGRNAFEFILQGQHHHDNKTIQRCHQKNYRPV